MPDDPQALTSAAPSTQDAIALMRAHHRAVGVLFDDCARLVGNGERTPARADHSAMLARIGALLQAHAQTEREILYPALAEAGAASTEVLQRAEAHHRELLARLESLAARSASREDIDQDLLALGTAARAHTRFEEEHVFPAARKLDLTALGARMALRRGQLLGDQGPD